MFRTLLIEGYSTTHVRTDLREGDDSFVRPRKALSIKVELLWTDPNEKQSILRDVIEGSLTSFRKFWQNLCHCTHFQVSRANRTIGRVCE
jgi:hypothetical protein